MKALNNKWYFGEFGGRFIPETLYFCLDELERNYVKYHKNKRFLEILNKYLIHYAGRPTPLYFAKNLSNYCGFKIYLKREDLC
ncbi:MAG: hypothetical protein QXO21_04500, partial [Candidatus Anstonellales archaeon]